MGRSGVLNGFTDEMRDRKRVSKPDFQERILKEASIGTCTHRKYQSLSPEEVKRKNKNEKKGGVGQRMAFFGARGARLRGNPKRGHDGCEKRKKDRGSFRGRAASKEKGRGGIEIRGSGVHIKKV